VKKSFINYTFLNQTIYLITTSSFNLVLLLLYTGCANKKSPRKKAVFQSW